MSSACYARSRGGFGFLSQRFHRLFATRPVRSETNKQFGGHVRCGGSGEHSRGFHPGGKTHSQEWLCHVPSTSCWAKVFGVPLGLVWGKFRLSRAWGTHCTCVCALDAVRNIQGASRWAEKAHSQEWLCHGQALEGGDQGWGLRASMNARTVMRRASAASRPSRITVAMVSGSGVAKQPQLICMPAA